MKLKKLEKKMGVNQIRNKSCKKIWLLSMISGLLVAGGLSALGDAIASNKLGLVNATIGFLVFAVICVCLTRSIAAKKDRYIKLIELDLTEKEIEDAYAVLEGE